MTTATPTQLELAKELRAKAKPPRNQQKAQPDKNAVTEAEAVSLDQSLRAAAKTATASMARVALLIQEAKSKEIWKLLTDATSGQRYQTWQHYIGSVLGRSMEPLAAVDRNALIKMLLDEGLSQRAAAEGANTSPATVNAVAKGESPGERKPKPNVGGAPKGQSQQRANPADRAYDAVDRVVRRAQTYPDDLPIEDVERLIPKLRQAATVLNKFVKDYRAAVSEAQKRHPAGAKKPNTAA